MILPNKLYDILKKVLTIGVPAFVALLTTLTNVWKWDIPLDAIVTSITGVATFIGVCLGISTKQYNEKSIEEHAEGRGGNEV